MSRPTVDLLKIGGCEVNPATDEIYRDGATIKVEPRAMRVLMYLAERAGQVISVEELLDNVWANVIVTPDSVYTAVAALRRALGDDNKASPYIVNVPRRGYRLVAEVTQPSVAEAAAMDAAVPPPESADPVPREVAAATASTERAARNRSLWLPTLGMTLAIAALVYLGVRRPWVAKSPLPAVAAAKPAPSARNEKSIAVLPFVDMSEKHDQEYFADGMAEEILDLLAKVPGLMVIGRTSSFQFKDQNRDLRAIGAALGAAYIVEGSVRMAGKRLRVTAQLIDAQTGRHVWSNSYDRDIGEALAVQSDIAQGLVRGLELSMGADGWWPTQAMNNSQAYTEYLRGRHATDRFDQEGLQEAVGYLSHALELDPKLTRAAEALAFAEDVRAEFGFVPAREGFARARKAAEAALQLDPNTVIAHVAMARINTVYEWNWKAAEQHASEALRISPRDPAALMAAGDLARTQGRWDEAIRCFNESIIADPLFPVTHVELGWTYYRSGRLAKAEAEMRRALEISPTYAGAHWTLGKILLAQGRNADALSAMQLEAPENGGDAGLALAYFALGKTAESDAALHRLVANGADNLASGIAQVYAFRGDAESAVRWLDRAYEQKDMELYLIKGDPVFAKIEADSRYVAFLRRMKLAQLPL